ncbi:MAG: hypothetical protein ACUVUU_00800 [bacterium]
MKRSLPLTICILLFTCLLSAFEPDLTRESLKRITNAAGQSRTARGNARCICATEDGKIHMVWEDDRRGNYDIYYAWCEGEKVSENIQICATSGESSFPCIACFGKDVFILWEEKQNTFSNIFYVHLKDGKEIARKQITRSRLDSSCPVAVADNEGNLHIAWHEGPYKQTAIYYGKIVSDSLVETIPICTKHPEAFRPDMACDDQGRLLIVWIEGNKIRSKLYDGSAWGEEMLVGETATSPWRISSAWLGDQRWATSWFDNTAGELRIKFKVFDGKNWTNEQFVDEAVAAYYPSIVRVADDDIFVLWEQVDKNAENRKIVLRRFRKAKWSQPLTIYDEKSPGRYASGVWFADKLHIVYFSSLTGNDEIFYLTLRRKL